MIYFYNLEEVYQFQQMFQFFQHLPSNELLLDPLLEIGSSHDELVERTEQEDLMEKVLHYRATQ